MSAQVSTHLNEIPTELREPAKSIRPEAPPREIMEALFPANRARRPLT